jgi:hypothetical protein
MKILDKQRFLNAMLELFRSVDHISAVGDGNTYVHEDGETEVTAEDFIQAYKTYELSKGESPTDRQVEYTEGWIRGWITNGPLFIVFNEPGLLKEVNDYLIMIDGARDESPCCNLCDNPGDPNECQTECCCD